MSRERELLQWSYDILECIGWQVMPLPREKFKARLAEISAILAQPEAERVAYTTPGWRLAANSSDDTLAANHRGPVQSAAARGPDACPSCRSTNKRIRAKVVMNCLSYDCVDWWHNSAPPTQGATPPPDALVFLLQTLDKELLDTKLVTAQQWNATIAPRLSALHIHLDALRAENERLRKELDEARK